MDGSSTAFYLSKLVTTKSKTINEYGIRMETRKKNMMNDLNVLPIVCLTEKANELQKYFSKCSGYQLMNISYNVHNSFASLLHSLT